MKPEKNSLCNCGSGKKFKHCCGNTKSRTSLPSPAEIDKLVALYKAGCYVELENEAQTLLELYPGSGIVWQLWGGALQMLGKDALHAFQKTAELLPDDTQAFYNLGIIQKNLGQLANSVASYRRAIELKPDFTQAHDNLGNVLQLIRTRTPLREFPHHVFIVGAQKAGTTALYSYLLNHPMIFGGKEKELGYFHRDAIYEKATNNYLHGFSDSASGSHAIDATPEYMYHSKSAERIRAFRSDAKIIMLLREPVSRAFSAFNMYQQYNDTKAFRDRLQLANADAKAFFMPLDEGAVKPDIHYFLDREMAMINGKLEGEEPALIRRGIYAPQVKRFIQHFGQKNVLVLFSDDLMKKSEITVNRVFGFLGLEAPAGIQYPLEHVREYTVDPAAKNEIHRYAAALFEKDRQELQDVYGFDIPWR